jgi:hypothetical protein
MLANKLFQELIDEASTAALWADARCRDGAGTMTPLFFSEQIDDIGRAKAICARCPVMVPCLPAVLQRKGAGAEAQAGPAAQAPKAGDRAQCLRSSMPEELYA